MKNKRNWIIVAIAATITGVVVSQSGRTPTVENPPTQIAVEITSTATPSPTATYEGCGYMWAYHDDPELSQKLNESIQTLNPSAEANVQLFGEDCVYADGHSTFSVMETDFYVRLRVDDLNDFESFGNWVKQAMSAITSLPDDEIQGKPGFVEFSFIKSDAEQIVIRVVISDYQNIDSNVSGKELFALFYTPPPPSTTPVPPTPTP